MQKTKQLAQQLCLMTAVLSAFGFALRWAQNISIFDEETHLATPGAMTSRLIVLVSLASLAIFAFRLLPLSGCPMGVEPAADVRGDGRAYKLLCLLSGALVAAGGLMILFGFGVTPGLLTRVLGILAAIAGCGIIHAGVAGKSGADSPISAFFSAEPVLFGCFWLIVSYKDHAANPVVWAYCVEVIAIAAATLALHFTAGFVFCRPRTYSTALLLCSAAYCCFTALGDERAAALQLCFGGLGLFFVATMRELVSAADVSDRHFARPRRLF
jgi:hypothetical protein